MPLISKHENVKSDSINVKSSKSSKAIIILHSQSHVIESGDMGERKMPLFDGQVIKSTRKEKVMSLLFPTPLMMLTICVNSIELKTGKFDSSTMLRQNRLMEKKV